MDILDKITITIIIDFLSTYKIEKVRVKKEEQNYN